MVLLLGAQTSNRTTIRRRAPSCLSRRLKLKEIHSQDNRVSHRFPEAVVLIDVAVLRKQFKPVAQSHPAPDAFSQLPSLDIVHFARLTVLKDDALAAQPQPTVILSGKQAHMHGDAAAQQTRVSPTRHPFWARLTSADRSSSSRGGP